MGWLGPALGVAGSIFGGLFGAHASNNAANQYIHYLEQGQNFLKDQEKQGLANYQPYMDTGSQASRTLADLTSSPGSGLLKNWDQTFVAPTAEEAEKTPGYQFQLKQGLDAVQNSAAGRGGLLSGRTVADLNNYAQGTAASNYQNVFNNDFTQYQSAYNTFLNNQNNTFNRLLGLSGQGLQAANGAGGFMENMGGDIASLYAQMGGVRAGGTLGAAAGYTSILPGAAKALSPMGGGMGGGGMGGGMFGGGGGMNFGSGNAAAGGGG